MGCPITEHGTFGAGGWGGLETDCRVVFVLYYQLHSSVCVPKEGGTPMYQCGSQLHRWLEWSMATGAGVQYPIATAKVGFSVDDC